VYVEMVKILQEVVRESALPHFLFYQLQIVADEAEIEHVGWSSSLQDGRQRLAIQGPLANAAESRQAAE